MIKMLKMSPYSYPEQVSSSQLSKDLNDAYSQEDIVIENYVPTPSRGISREVRRKFKKIKYEERNDGKIIIHRFAMFPEGKNPILRAVRYMLVSIRQLQLASKSKDVDIIYSASTPPTQGVLCGMMKKKLVRRYGHHVPYLYCLQDVFPDSLVNSNMTRQGSLIWKIGRKIEDYTYRSADRIIVISQDIKDNIMGKGVPAEKISVIPNWIDTETVRPVPRSENKLFDELGISREGFYVTYAGNLGKAQSIDTILEAAESLIEVPDIQFIIFGEGSGKEEAERKAGSLPNVRMFPLMPPERVPEVYSLGDVSIVCCKKGFGKGAIPSKTVSIMATGTPVMLSFDRDSELWKLIEDHDCGFLCDAEDAAALSEAVREAKDHREMIENKGQNALDLVKSEYSKEYGPKEYISVIRQLVSSNNKD